MVGQRGNGDLIARGNTSDVWRWSGTQVLKLLRPDIPYAWASLEADITRRVHEAGLPAPATEGLVEVDGRPGIVLEHVEGVSMWARMKDEPSSLPGLVDELVDLQLTIQAAGPIDGLPEMVARLRLKIEEAEQVSAEERDEAQALLADMPVGTALCHGDIHPANVLLAARGWVVVDWFDAAIGHADADLVRSSLLMRPPASQASSNRHLDGASVDMLERLHSAYLAALGDRRLIEPDAFARWEAALAVARMSEPVQKADLVTIWRQWRRSQRAPVS